MCFTLSAHQGSVHVAGRTFHITFAVLPAVKSRFKRLRAAPLGFKHLVKRERRTKEAIHDQS